VAVWGDNVTSEEKVTQEAMQRVCLGNQDAIRFLNDITDVLHLWDDLIDRDHELPDAHINKTMWIALVALPRNPFYVQHFMALNSILVTAIVNWQIATDMERKPSSDNEEVIAFIIRSSYIDIITLVAVLCGGPDHATSIMREARQLWHSEELSGYRQNLIQERLSREGAQNG
jgi:hypothetical protein